MLDKLGFKYDVALFSGVPTSAGVERACVRFQKRFPEYIWNDSVVDGKAYTLPQVRIVLEGVTHGGGKVTDKNDILNQRRSLELLVTMVRTGKFDIQKPAFCSLHEIAAREEALSWGVFRTGSVGIAGADYVPPPFGELDKIYASGIQYIATLPNALERAILFFLFGAMHQFFYDANKRTARLMMNGILLANGFDALVIDASKRNEYNQVMLNLYNRKDGDSAIRFLLNSYRNQDLAKSQRTIL